VGVPDVVALNKKTGKGGNKMKKSRKDIKNALLKKISGAIEEEKNYTVAHEWVVIFGKFLSALDIEANTKGKVQ